MLRLLPPERWIFSSNQEVYCLSEVIFFTFWAHIMHFGNLMTYFLEWYIQSNRNWVNVDDQVLWYQICFSQSQMGNLCQYFRLAQNLWKLLSTFQGCQSWAGSWNLGCMNVDVFSFMLSTFHLIVVVWQFESLHKTKSNKQHGWRWAFTCTA